MSPWLWPLTKPLRPLDQTPAHGHPCLREISKMASLWWTSVGIHVGFLEPPSFLHWFVVV